MELKLTAQAESALEYAKQAAMEFGQTFVGSEHILVGLIRVSESLASKILAENGVNEDNITEMILDKTSPEYDMSVTEVFRFTPKAQKILEKSTSQAIRLKSATIGSEHILMSVLRESESVAVRLLETLGISIQKILMDILMASGFDSQSAKAELKSMKSGNKNKKGSVLEQYSTDLTQLAKEGRLDPIIGRKAEMDRVIQILSRRTKNNPCLIGEPGVGKTAIAEGLAKRIVDGEVPQMMIGKKIRTIDLAGLVAGSKYRGEFEERMKRLLFEVKNEGNTILFLDEIHTMIGAGGAEGAIDASNIMKPSLARGEIQLIGATTREEYRKYIEKDAALERRFQPVVVEEPTKEETIDILNGLKGKLQEHHNVIFTHEAIVAAVELAKRYIHDRYFPDKAIDLIDEAASRKNISAIAMPEQIKKLEESIIVLKQQKEAALIKGNLKKASEYKAQQTKKEQMLEKQMQKWQKAKEKRENLVEESDIAKVISMWTKIPVKQLEKKEQQRLLHLEGTLHERVIGQDEAVKAVSKAVKRGRVGLKDPNRPIGSFLFLGPTGVGKTELCKALAEAMFGDEEAMIRVDMSEYMEKHSVSKLIGSPPGYVGYEDGGQFSEKVRRNPYSVILLDEIEKAHVDVFNILLQVLDDGHITDSTGRKIDFRNTIIIMTSNAGAQRIMAPKTLGFASVADEKKNYEVMKAGVMDEISHVFRPEFLNRIDEIIVFHSLGKEQLIKILQLLMNTLIKRAKEQMNLELEVDESVYPYILKIGYDEKYGARPLRRALQQEMEDLLADKILSGEIASGDVVFVQVLEEKLSITKKV
ncbi:MAG: ATP-dependent Clp protease ATP-binding subunit [Lachnospiraceae bacterium]